jgi:hypothetical protein
MFHFAELLPGQTRCAAAEAAGRVCPGPPAGLLPPWHGPMMTVLTPPSACRRKQAISCSVTVQSAAPKPALAGAIRSSLGNEESAKRDRPRYCSLRLRVQQSATAAYVPGNIPNRTGAISTRSRRAACCDADTELSTVAIVLLIGRCRVAFLRVSTLVASGSPTAWCAGC